MLQYMFRPGTTYTDWRYARTLLRGWDLGRGWKRAPVTLAGANFVLPCTRIPMVASNDILDSAVAGFRSTSNDSIQESVFQSMVVVRKGAKAISAMRMAEASFDCSKWQVGSERIFRVHRVDVPLAEHDHVAYQLEETTEGGTVRVNLIVVRIGYMIARIYHSKRDIQPSIEQTTQLMLKVIRKIVRYYPKLRSASSRLDRDWFHDAPVPDSLRFATPELGDVPIQMVLTDRRTLAADQQFEHRDIGVVAAEQQTYSSLKDFCAFETRSYQFDHDDHAIEWFCKIAHQIGQTLDPPVATQPCDVPIEVAEAICAAGNFTSDGSNLRIASILIRHGSIVSFYSGVTVESEPLGYVHGIVNRILGRGVEQ